MSDNYLHDLFINEVKGALNSGGGIGRIDQAAIEILSETTAVFAEQDGAYMSPDIVPSEALVKDTLYRVIWDGAPYEVTCTEFSNEDGFMYLIGNVGLVGLQDTGEPFLVAYNNDMWMAFAATAENHTISISKVVEVATVSPAAVNIIRYPIIDLTEYQTSSDASTAIITSDSVQNMLNTYLMNGTPAILVKRKHITESGSRVNVFVDFCGYHEEYLNGDLDMRGFINGRVWVTCSNQTGVWGIISLN